MKRSKNHACVSFEVQHAYQAYHICCHKNLARYVSKLRELQRKRTQFRIYCIVELRKFVVCFSPQTAQFLWVPKLVRLNGSQYLPSLSGSKVLCGMFSKKPNARQVLVIAFQRNGILPFTLSHCMDNIRGLHLAYKWALYMGIKFAHIVMDLGFHGRSVHAFLSLDPMAWSRPRIQPNMYATGCYKQSAYLARLCVSDGAFRRTTMSMQLTQ